MTGILFPLRPWEYKLLSKSHRMHSDPSTFPAAHPLHYSPPSGILASLLISRLDRSENPWPGTKLPATLNPD